MHSSNEEEEEGNEEEGNEEEEGEEEEGEGEQIQDSGIFFLQCT